MKKKKYRCPYCGALSLDEENSWDICELCDWDLELFMFTLVSDGISSGLKVIFILNFYI